MYSRHDPFNLSSSVLFFNSLRETCIGAEFGQLKVFWKICELLPVFTSQVSLYSCIGWRSLICCQHFWWHYHGFQVVRRYGLPRTLRTFGNFPGQFSTHIRYCSVDTELIDGNNCPKNHFDGFVAAIEMKRQLFPNGVSLKVSSGGKKSPRSVSTGRHGMSSVKSPRLPAGPFSFFF